LKEITHIPMVFESNYPYHIWLLYVAVKFHSNIIILE
jgi:hypothetical protein